MIDSRDQVVRSGWVGFRQQICSDLLVGGDHIALNDEAGSWSDGFLQHGAEANVDGIGNDVCHAPWEDDVVFEAIELHEEP
jgi:hypothetical protein